MIKYIRKVFSLSLIISPLLLLVSCAPDRDSRTDSYKDINPTLSHRINQQINASDPHVNVGMMVESLKTGKVVFAKNPERFYTPASILKSITAAASLRKINNDFRYQTEIRCHKHQYKNRTVQGSIEVLFDGDPTLTLKNLEKLFSGIKSIKGDIIISGKNFNVNPPHFGRMAGDKNYCFGAPVHPLILNKNCVTLKTTPQKKHVRVQQMPFKYFSRIDTTGVTTTPQDIPLVPYIAPGEVVLKGPVTYKRSLDVGVDDPIAFMKKALFYILKKNKISFSGKIKFNNKVHFKHVIARHTSPRLFDLVSELHKESDNLIADSLFLKMTHLHYDQPATWHQAHQALREVLEDIDLKETVIVDGSGLSRYNSLTPKQFLNFLVRAYKDEKIREPFLKTFPVSGVDGTLKYRMNSSDLKGRVFAKTGSMKSVCTLAGYLDTKKGNRLAFVIFINGFVDSLKKYYELQDEICRLLINTL